MNWCLITLAAAAPIPRRKAMELLRTGFNKELASNELIAYAAGAVALIALVLLLTQILAQRKQPRSAPRRDYLAEALKILGLSREERTDLLEVAGRARLPNPASMLLSPANLAFALSRAPMDGPAGPLRARLDALSHKLFGEGLPGAAPPRAPAPAAGVQSASSTADGSQPV